MRNTKKKGFTIIELVVVVAVIAILAAVLIPTFSGIIARANRSADEQTVANMNKYVALAAENDERKEKNFELASEAVNVLYANGFNAGKLETYSKGYHYAYDKENNKFYLLDDKADIVFPETNKTVADLDLWGFFNNSKLNAINDANGDRVVKKYIALTPITDESLFNEPDCVFYGTGYTLDLNKKAINVDNGTAKNITLLNGSILSTVAGGYEYGDDVKAQEAATVASIQDIDPDVNGKVTIENKMILNERGSLTFGFKAGTTAVEFKNCTIANIEAKATTIGGTGSKITSITLDGCDINLPMSENTADGKALFLMSDGGETPTDVTVKNCSITCYRGLVFGNTKTVSYYGNIVFENNVFVNDGDNAKALIQFAGKNEFKASSITFTKNQFVSGQVAIRIHSSINTNGMECLSQNVTFSENTFANGMNKVDGDDKNAYTYTTADAWEAKIK